MSRSVCTADDKNSDTKKKMSREIKEKKIRIISHKKNQQKAKWGNGRENKRNNNSNNHWPLGSGLISLFSSVVVVLYRRPTSSFLHLFPPIARWLTYWWCRDCSTTTTTKRNKKHLHGILLFFFLSFFFPFSFPSQLGVYTSVCSVWANENTYTRSVDYSGKGELLSPITKTPRNLELIFFIIIIIGKRFTLIIRFNKQATERNRRRKTLQKKIEETKQTPRVNSEKDSLGCAPRSFRKKKH